MSIVYRNQAIARIAYAFAQVDGKVHPDEIDAVSQFLQANPKLFDAQDQAEVMAYFKDFLMRKPKIQEILPDSRLQRIHEYLFQVDRAVVYQLMEAIAKSHEGISKIESDFLSKIEPYLLPAVDEDEL